MRKTSLAYRLNLSVMVLMLFIFISASYAILMINKTSGYAEQVTKKWLPSIDASKDVALIIQKLTRSQISAVLEKNEDTKKELLLTIKDQKETLVDYMKTYESLIDNPKERKEYDEFKSSMTIYLENSDKAIELAQQGKELEGYELLKTSVFPVLIDMQQNISTIIDINNGGANSSSRKGSSLTSITNTTMVVIIILSLLVSLFIFRVIKVSTDSIALTIKDLKSQSISSHEIGESLKQGAQSISDTIEKQFASIQATTASISQITSMSNRTSENTKELTTTSKIASTKAEQGQQVMHRLVTSMDTIQESNNKLQNIVVIINQINSKTTVINEIVSKTELLSLNASIESARAGEHGKGFAVVAEEVGNLAKVSGKAAHEIQELITASQEQVNKIVNETKLRVEEGKKVTNEVQSSFSQIFDDINTMNSSIGQIADAAREQEIGVREISSAITVINSSIQQSQLTDGLMTTLSGDLVSKSLQLENTAKNMEFLILGKKSSV